MQSLKGCLSERLLPAACPTGSSCSLPVIDDSMSSMLCDLFDYSLTTSSICGYIRVAVLADGGAAGGCAAHLQAVSKRSA